MTLHRVDFNIIVDFGRYGNLCPTRFVVQLARRTYERANNGPHFHLSGFTLDFPTGYLSLMNSRDRCPPTTRMTKSATAAQAQVQRLKGYTGNSHHRSILFVLVNLLSTHKITSTYSILLNFA